MTAAVAAPARIPGQAGAPALEVDQAVAERWQLVQAAQAGDREAFGRIYELYADTVFRFIVRRLNGDHLLAEDLTADTFVRALRRIDSVTWQGRDLAAWLVTIARNLVADHFKSSHYRRVTSVADMLDPASGIDAADHTQEGDPAALVAEHFQTLDLLAAVKQLGAEQQECIRLRFLLGLSVAETASEMGKNEGAIKALQYRAVRQLARRLPASFQGTR